MAVITISRKLGAGGKTIGKMIAEKMRYTLFDNELIQLVAEKAKISSEKVHLTERDSSGMFRNFVRGLIPKPFSDLIPKPIKAIMDSGVQIGAISEEVYADILQKIIIKIAEGDNAVIIGRASQYILQNTPNTFHILATADKEDRIQFVVGHYELTFREAMKAIDLEDKRRSNLYRKFGKYDYDEPHTYHLVLNTSKISLDAGCELICELITS